MAKLNQTEISAIAEQIAENIDIKNKEYNKKLEEKEYSKWERKFEKDLRGQFLREFCRNSIFASNYTKHLSYSIRVSKHDFETIKKDIFSKEISLRLKNVRTNKDSIKRDIIINQAKGTEIEKLIKELTEKYSQ